MSVHIDTSENFHPDECYGAPCRHCERRVDDTHDPATCALCDPDYDMRPNEHRVGAVTDRVAQWEQTIREALTKAASELEFREGRQPWVDESLAALAALVAEANLLRTERDSYIAHTDFLVAEANALRDDTTRPVPRAPAPGASSPTEGGSMEHQELLTGRILSAEQVASIPIDSDGERAWMNSERVALLIHSHESLRADRDEAVRLLRALMRPSREARGFLAHLEVRSILARLDGEADPRTKLGTQRRA